MYHNSDGARMINQSLNLKDTPYLALMGEIWCSFCENFGENWPGYNGIALYITNFSELITFNILQIWKKT